MRKKINAHFEVNHCFAQRQLVDWKYKHLQQFVRTPPKPRQGNGNRVAYRFATRSLPEFTELYDLFYDRNNKEIPRQISLDPLILAVWFMDDGSKSRNSVYLNTQQFSLADQQLLIKKLQEDLGIESTLNRDKQYFRIRIRTASMSQFGSYVLPYIIPSFLYKLP